MTPNAVLDSSVSYLDQIFTISGLDLQGRSPLTEGDFFLIDDEICRIDSVDGDELNVGRGCADTIPAPHDAGAMMWFFENYIGTDAKEYADGQVIGVKLLPFTTGGGSVPIANSPPNEVTFVSRMFRPYPPAALECEGVEWYTSGFTLDSLNDALNIIWRERNRVVQADQLVSHNDPGVTPEEGQVTTLEIYNAADDSFLKAYQTSSVTFNYTRSQATFDFGLSEIFDPDEQDGYILVGSRRDDVESLYKYRINFHLVPGSIVEQPFGLGYRLGECLGGFPAGTVDDLYLSGAMFIVSIGGKLLYDKSTGVSTRDIYISEDNGRTFYMAKSNADPIGYGDGVRHWNLAMGSQYISVGINRLALDVGIYEGTDDIDDPVTHTPDAPFTNLGEALHVGCVAQIGSYYYAVARYASDNNSNTNLHKFYLFRAGADLEFILQGEMTQMSGDPNALPSGTIGEFISDWFTPNGSVPGIYENFCEFWRGYANRWFIKSTTQLYYTDHSTGTANWRRAPVPLPYPSTYNRYLRAVPKLTNGQIYACYPNESNVSFFRSTDNGANWFTQTRETTGFQWYDTLYPAPVYFDGEWVQWVSRAWLEPPDDRNLVAKTTTMVWPAAALTPVMGIKPTDDPLLRYIDVVTSDTVVGRDNVLRQIYSEDGINFSYAEIEMTGVVFLQNFTTDESDETGNTTPVLWNDAAVSGGVVQFSGDGYMRVAHPYGQFNFGRQENWTVEVFVKIDDVVGAIPDQWIMVYGDTATERTSSALSIRSFSSGSSTDTGFRCTVQTRTSSGTITTHSLTSSVTFDVDVLHHVVIQRRALLLEMFVDGVLVDEDAIAADSITFGRPTGVKEDVFFGGGSEDGGTGTGADNEMTGSISATRVTRGTTVYPYAGFTVPTLPLTV